MQPLPKSIFITGIGTGVGKTIASATFVEALQADYWKPIQCGNLENSDSKVVESLITNQVSQIHPEAYKLKTASSPHYAARVEEVDINIEKCIAPVADGHLIIEGAGGLMVPLNTSECVVDLISALEVPVVLVCRNYLGSINHTLLSIELLRQEGIKLLGLIFSGDNYLDNEEVIEHFSQVKMLGRIDETKVVDKDFIHQQATYLRMSLSKYYLL
jgi:dethiobiotin synthetase